MRVNSLDRKLLRELWRLRGQIFSIALVVATGVMTVITMRGSYDSLRLAQQNYYRMTRFADVWAPLKRAPEALRSRIAALPGVAAVDTRVTLLATLDIEALDAPAQGHFISLPTHGRPVLNDYRLRAGRELLPGAPDEVLISENFADAHGFVPGDSLRALINGRSRTLDIVGIAISPEHVFVVPPGSLMPDDKRYGVFWMDREVLGPAYDMDGAFNEVMLRLAPGANPQAVMAELDTLLDPYGGLGAYPRRDQASHVILQGELDQNRVMGTAIPAIFLAVAAFLLNLVLGRLIATQRNEIAVLKAFGYHDREVARHFLMFALVAVAIGCVVGVPVGIWLGGEYMRLYGTYFDFPSLTFQLDPRLLLIAVFVSVGAAVSGALGAVMRAASLPPAEAMRAEPPADFRPGWMERSGLSQLLPASGRMIVRNLERQPARALLSSLGVAFSVAILMIGLYMFDGMAHLIDIQFRVIQREDMTVSFDEPIDAAVRHDLGRLQGVARVETFREVPVRLRAAHRHRAVSVLSLEPGTRLRRIVAANGKVHPLPVSGIVLSDTLARKLRISVGEQIGIEVLEGRRTRETVQIAGIVKDFIGMSAYMDSDALQRLVEGPRLVSGAWLVVDADEVQAISHELKSIPLIAGVSTPSSMLDAFQKQLDEGMFIAIGFLLGFAGVIAGAVIYNGARIALSERGHELASLRVMGYRRQEVTWLLTGEQAIVTLVAIPLGWCIGYGLSFLVSRLMDNDSYRIPFVISPRTYVLSALLTLVAALASAALVRRRIDRLDLVSVLKTRE